MHTTTWGHPSNIPAQARNNRAMCATRQNSPTPASNIRSHTKVAILAKGITAKSEQTAHYIRAYTAQCIRAKQLNVSEQLPLNVSEQNSSMYPSKPLKTHARQIRVHACVTIRGHPALAHSTAQFARKRLEALEVIRHLHSSPHVSTCLLCAP
jgi:hypothetical protein